MMPRRSAYLLVLLSMLLSILLPIPYGAVNASGLADLLPADTIAALGMEDLNSHADKLEDFIDEFQRLGVGEALQAAFAGSAGAINIDALGDTGGTLPEELRGLSPLDVIGRDTWIAVSASSFNPLPTVTVLTRTSPQAQAAFEQLLSRESQSEEVQTLTEGEFTFYLLAGDSGLPGVTFAYAQQGDLLMLSSNPETLRGVLRQLGGNPEPSFTSSAAYAGTLGKLGNGNILSYLDYRQIARIASPLAQGFGFDDLVGRVTRALETAGTTAGVTRLTDDGIETESLQALNGAGTDLALYNLLSDDFAASQDALSFVPTTAVSVSSSHSDLKGWWNYLNDLTGSTPELGGDIDSLLGIFLNIDLRSSFFNWAGTQVTIITAAGGEVVQPGVPSSNLLGNSVYIVEAGDAEAARAGLASLLGSLGTTIASFADPSGGVDTAASSSSEIAGVTVESYDITSGISLSFAVTKNYALIATSKEALAAALEARQAGTPLQPTLAALRQDIPPEATGFVLSDERAALEGTAQQLGGQLQVAAGLGGSANLDFDAITQASDKLEAYLNFIASRLGGRLNYAEKSDGEIHYTGRVEVSW